jgi:hypothetical protein
MTERARALAGDQKTSVARTVADCFKFRNKIGLDVALEALREAWAARRVTMDELWRYAVQCRVARAGSRTCGSTAPHPRRSHTRSCHRPARGSTGAAGSWPIGWPRKWPWNWPATRPPSWASTTRCRFRCGTRGPPTCAGLDDLPGNFPLALADRYAAHLRGLHPQRCQRKIPSQGAAISAMRRASLAGFAEGARRAGAAGIADGSVAGCVI